MIVCPGCRAGKRWIDYELVNQHLLRPVVEYTCQRCGYTTRERERI